MKQYVQIRYITSTYSQTFSSAIPLWNFLPFKVCQLQVPPAQSSVQLITRPRTVFKILHYKLIFLGGFFYTFCSNENRNNVVI